MSLSRRTRWPAVPNALTRALRPGALCVAEDLKGWDMITRPARDGGFDFDTQWDGFVYVVTELLAPASDDGRDMSRARDLVMGRYNNDPFQRVVGTENHDTVGNGGARLPQRIDARDPGSFAARKRSMLGAAMTLTVPGVPMLFMMLNTVSALVLQITARDAPAPIIGVGILLLGLALWIAGEGAVALARKHPDPARSRRYPAPPACS